MTFLESLMVLRGPPAGARVIGGTAYGVNAATLQDCLYTLARSRCEAMSRYGSIVVLAIEAGRLRMVPESN